LGLDTQAAHHGTTHECEVRNGLLPAKNGLILISICRQRSFVQKYAHEKSKFDELSGFLPILAFNGDPHD
jgi:hypothetical protein